ncbi:hypothetical protein ACVYRA_003422 [Citrobacter amalonaticus]
MTLEKRIEKLEMSLLHTRQAINEINCAIDELSVSVRQQLVVDDKAVQKQTAVQLEDSGCKVHLPAGGVVVITRF